MVKQLTSYAAIVLFLTLLGVSSRAGLQQSRERLDQIERDLWADVPHLVCIDDNIATAAQPGEGAYIKLAAIGFRTVLSLRTSSEGIDQAKERTLVERAGLIYVNIPVASSDPKPEQAAAFLAAVRNRANYPMLIHCGSGSQRGRILDDLQGSRTRLARRQGAGGSNQDRTEQPRDQEVRDGLHLQPQTLRTLRSMTQPAAQRLGIPGPSNPLPGKAGRPFPRLFVNLTEIHGHFLHSDKQKTSNEFLTRVTLIALYKLRWAPPLNLDD